MKNFILLSLFISYPFILSADHIIGGFASYEIIEIDSANNQSTIEVSFRLYRDPNSGGTGFDRFADFGLYALNTSGEFEFLNTFNELHGPITSSEFAIASFTIESTEYIFETTLDHGQDYLIGYQRCCRSRQINNLTGTDLGIALQIEIMSDALVTPLDSPDLNNLPLSIVRVGDPIVSTLPIVADDILNVSTELASVLISAGAINDPSDCCECIIPNPRTCFPPFSMPAYRDLFSAENPFGDINDLAYTDDTFTGKMNISGSYQYGIGVESSFNSQLLSRQLLDYNLISVVTTSTSDNLANPITIFPNPSSGIVHLENATGLEYELINIHGQAVEQGMVEKQLNLEKYSGLFYLKLIDGESETVHRLVLQP